MKPFNPRRTVALLFSASMLLSACTGQLPGATQAPSAQRLQINNQAASLSSRLTHKNQRVPLQGFKTQAESPLELRLVAEVAPPVVNGRTVQATNVFIQDNLAYVSYDIAGPEYSGGMYIIDISNPAQPALLSEVTSPDRDFYAVARDGQQLYLPGATAQPAEGKQPALLQVLKLAADGRSVEGETAALDLPSYAATDVTVGSNAVYVTSGDLGGGVTRLNRQTQAKEGFYPLTDARAVSFQNDQLAVFRGTPGELHLLNGQLAPQKQIDLHLGGNIPVSQSTVRLLGQQAYVGAGNGGLLSVDLAQGNLISQIVAPAGITNGASVDGQYAFMAEGENGVAVAQVSNNGQMERLGSLQFGGFYSSNMVVHRDNVLFVANGKGGLSILTINQPSPEPSSSPSASTTPTPEPSATPTPEPSPTVTPSPEPTPTATPSVAPVGYQSVWVRWLQPNSTKVFSTRTVGTLTVTGGATIAGVITDRATNWPKLRQSDNLFAAQVNPQLPTLMNQTLQNRILESRDLFKLVNATTVSFDFELGNPTGSDEIRLILDYGDRPPSETQLVVSLDASKTYQAGITVGTDTQEVFQRTIPLATAAGPIMDSSYTLRPPVETDHNLIILREGTIAKNQLPSGLF